MVIKPFHTLVRAVFGVLTLALATALPLAAPGSAEAAVAKKAKTSAVAKKSQARPVAKGPRKAGVALKK